MRYTRDCLADAYPFKCGETAATVVKALFQLSAVMWVWVFIFILSHEFLFLSFYLQTKLEITFFDKTILSSAVYKFNMPEFSKIY